MTFVPTILVDGAEQEQFNLLRENPEAASNTAYTEHYNAVCDSLLAKRGKPKDERFRVLLQIYYSMEQESSDSVGNTSHRFGEIQHELEQHYQISITHHPLVKRTLNFAKHLLLIYDQK